MRGAPARVPAASARRRAEAPAYAAFVAMVAIVAWLTRRHYPALFVDHAMWAEAGTNFYRAAHLGTWYDRLFTLDYGYLPLMPRLIALVTWAAGVPSRLVPVAYSSMALVTFSIATAALCLPAHRRLIPSDACRALVCLALLMYPGFEQRTLTNVAYFLAYPALYTLLEARTATWSRAALIWRGAVVALAILSKPFFLVLVPPALLLVPLRWRHRGGRQLALPLTAALAGIVQAATMATHRTADLAAQPRVGLSEGLALLRTGFQVVLSAGVGCGALVPDARVVGPPMAGLVLLGLALGVFTSRTCPRALAAWVWPVAVLGTAVIGSLVLNIAAQPNLMRHTITPAAPFGIVGSRHFFVAATAVLLAGVLLLAQLPRPLPLVALGAWLVVTQPFGLRAPPPAVSWPLVGFSQWSLFSPWDPNDPVRPSCLPVDPAPWAVTGACQLLVQPADLNQAPALPRRPADALQVAAPRAAAGAQVDTVGLFLAGDTGARTVRLVAYDAGEQAVGLAEAEFLPARVLTYFRFPAPVAGVARLALEAAEGLGVAWEGEAPAWFWFGHRDASGP